MNVTNCVTRTERQKEAYGVSGDEGIRRIKGGMGRGGGGGGRGRGEVHYISTECARYYVEGGGKRRIKTAGRGIGKRGNMIRNDEGIIRNEEIDRQID